MAPFPFRLSTDLQRPLLAKLTVGARLHFGLLAFEDEESSFGGTGVMIDRPGLELRMYLADSFHAGGVLSDRILHFARLWQEATARKLPRVHLAARGTLRDHAGLGCGTQLGLAVGTLLSKAAQFPLPDLETLAATVNRARRSAIGCHGFLQGGFLLETGHRQPHGFPKLAFRAPLPSSWRIVLAIQRQVHGRHGEEEESGFRELARIPGSTTDQLLRLVRNEMIPGLEQRDARRFGEAVYEYGCLAGDCYVSLQGGRYANRLCEELVQRMREFGISGVGQSSWGPTIFGLCEDALQAEALFAHLRERYSENEMHLEISQPMNEGARLVMSEDP